MKKIFILILIILLIIAGVYFAYQKPIQDNLRKEQIENNGNRNGAGIGSSAYSDESLDSDTINSDNLKNINMKLISSTFEDSKYIPSKYTCDGANINPPLSIVGAPEEAKSLVLIVDDPDAPNGDWVHWTIFNMPPDTKEIREGEIPAGSVEGKTNFRNPGYGGPCPPSGIHHYQFKLYALDAILNLGVSADKKAIEGAMNGHIIAEDLLVGLYKRL